jgi:hypothetical protein
MERTQLVIEQELAVLGGEIPIPCDERGTPA